jgi:hypothetical protein
VKCADGSNVPIIVSSDILFDGLLNLVAEKLGHFPGLVKLRYWLDSDKPKAGATSIQSPEELQLFKERMRGLIVPQRLTSGRISTRQLKAVRVFFEDGADEGTALTSKQGTKKVRSCAVHTFIF